MTQQLINVGTNPGDGTGDKGQVPFQKVNSNFSELYPKIPFYGIDSGLANAYVVTTTVQGALTLTAGVRVHFLPLFNNTGPSTVNVNGLGSRTITNADVSALTANQLRTGQLVTICFDGTQWQLVGASASGVMSATIVRPVTGYEVFKPATTSRNSLTVLTADPDLSITLNEIGTYEYESLFAFYATTTATMGMNCQLNSTNVAGNNTAIQFGVINGAFVGIGSGGMGPFSQTGSAVSNGGTPGTISTTAGIPDYMFCKGTLTITAAGILVWKWAQVTSNANNLNVVFGSYLRCNRIG